MQNPLPPSFLKLIPHPQSGHVSKTSSYPSSSDSCGVQSASKGLTSLALILLGNRGYQQSNSFPFSITFPHHNTIGHVLDIFKSVAQNEPKPNEGIRLYPNGYSPLCSRIFPVIAIPFLRNSSSSISLFHIRTNFW